MRGRVAAPTALRAAALVAGVLFVLLSIALARVLSANGAERAAIEDALSAQVRGDAGALRGLAGACETGCAVLARRLRRAGDSLPVVQCLRLRRTGDVVRGIEVEVTRLSVPVPRRGSCEGVRAGT